MSTNVQIIRGSYEDFARGDVESVLEIFDDDITWVEAEGGPYGGVYHGPEEVVEGVFGPIGADWNEFRVQPEGFIDGGETVVATGHYRGTHAETGQSFEAPFAHVWMFEGGQVTRFEQYVDTALHNEPLEG